MRKCPETRVLIAKDVLKSLRSKHLIPSPGIYLSSDSIDTYNHPEIIGQQLCGLLKQKPCEVCAIGALFVSQVERFNKLEFQPNTMYSHNYRSYLSKAFSMSQLNLIEACFEGFTVEKTGYNGYEYSSKYPKGEKRMAAIMRNIIKNNGTFIPNVK